jgi:hypothetical protein
MERNQGARARGKTRQVVTRNPRGMNHGGFLDLLWMHSVRVFPNIQESAALHPQTRARR